MNKADYLESQRGKTYTQIVNEQPMVNVVGAIFGENLRNVVAILAGGLQYRLDNAPDSEIRTALLTGFRYMTLPDYAFNLAAPDVHDLLQKAVNAQLVTPDEYALFLQLATYQKPQFEITREDCADYFGGMDWQPLTTSNATVNIWLKTKAPESTHIVIQHQDTLPDGSLSDWRHSTAVHGIELVGEYQAAIPNKAGRVYRWRCEYSLDCVVS